jgi:hypothetical protein
MPRRSMLSAAERDSLLALPDNQDDLPAITPSANQTCPSSANIEAQRTAWALPFSFVTCAIRA